MRPVVAQGQEEGLAALLQSFEGVQGQAELGQVLAGLLSHGVPVGLELLWGEHLAVGGFEEVTLPFPNYLDHVVRDMPGSHLRHVVRRGWLRL